MRHGDRVEKWEIERFRYFLCVCLSVGGRLGCGWALDMDAPAYPSASILWPRVTCWVWRSGQSYNSIDSYAGTMHYFIIGFLLEAVEFKTKDKCDLGGIQIRANSASNIWSVWSITNFRSWQLTCKYAEDYSLRRNAFDWATEWFCFISFFFFSRNNEQFNNTFDVRPAGYHGRKTGTFHLVSKHEIEWFATNNKQGQVKANKCASLD